MAEQPRVVADPLALPYNLEPAFERAVVFYEATSEEFHRSVGRHLNPKLMGAVEAQVLVAAVHSLVRGDQDMVPNPDKKKRGDGSTGKFPSSKLIVTQRAFLWSAEGGRITIEQAAACAEYLELGADVPGMVDVLGELSLRIKRYLVAAAHKQVFNAAAPDSSSDQANLAAQAYLEEARTVGKVQPVRLGVVLGTEAIGEIVRVGRMTRLPIGIDDVDAIIRGGMRRGETLVWGGSANAGKTAAMCQEAAMAWSSLRFTCYATLESISEDIYAKVISGLTAIPITAIQDTKAGADEATARLNWLLQQGWLGRLVVNAFPKRATTLKDIFDWVSCEEREAGGTCDKLIIDMDRHVNHKYSATSTAENYEDMYAQMITWAQGPDQRSHPELSHWLTTASHVKNQAGRRGGNEKILTDDDLSESTNKGRLFDGAAILNPRGDNKELVVINFSRSRSTPTGCTTELPTGYANGQLVQATFPYPWFKPGYQDRWKEMAQQELLKK